MKQTAILGLGMIGVIGWILGGSPAWASAGITFHEPMQGSAMLSGGKVAAKVDLVAVVQDLASWSQSPAHAAIVYGNAWVGSSEVHVSGTLDLMSEAEDGEEPGHYLRYDLKTNGNGPSFELKCSKTVPEGAHITLVTELTTCRGELLGYSNSGSTPQDAPLVLKFDWENPITTAQFLASFKVTGTSSVAEEFQARTEFFKVYFGGLWEGLVATHSAFTAPGSAAAWPDGKDPYACSLHWFRLPDQTLVGIDVIRSGASSEPAQVDQFGLRFFLMPANASQGQATDASARWLIHTDASNRWQNYFQGVRPELSQIQAAQTDKPLLGRGTGWIAGAISMASGETGFQASGIHDVAFLLDIAPEAAGMDNADLLGMLTGEATDWALNLSALDYPRVRTFGYLRVDGVEYPALDTEGPASIHHGKFLTDYGYFATVPVAGAAPAPQILVSAIRGDDLGGSLATGGAETMAYAFGQNGVPGHMLELLTKGLAPGSRVIKLGSGEQVELSDLQVIPHELFGVPTWTALGWAHLHQGPGLWPWQWFRHKELELGQVAVDFRGDSFIGVLRQ